jgi:hypothetical protein
MWDLHEEKESLKECRLRPGMDHYKGASYMSHSDEREVKNKEDALLRAAEKANQADSREVLAAATAGKDTAAYLEEETRDAPSGGHAVDKTKQTRKKKLETKKKRASTDKKMADMRKKSKAVVKGTRKVEDKDPKEVVAEIPVTPPVPTRKKRVGCEEVPKASDASFCRHYGVQELMANQCCNLDKRSNDHYAGEGYFLYGVGCKKCGTPAAGMKKVTRAINGNVAFMCKMGLKAFVAREESQQQPYCWTDRKYRLRIKSEMSRTSQIEGKRP